METNNPILNIPNQIVKQLELFDPLKPTTWIIILKKNNEKINLKTKKGQKIFFHLKNYLEDKIINISTDQLGRHEYIILKYFYLKKTKIYTKEKILKNFIFKIYTEEDQEVITTEEAKILNLIKPKEEIKNKKYKIKKIKEDKLCPIINTENYNYINQLSLGPLKRILISDLKTLTNKRNLIPIFKEIKLIINCKDYEYSKNTVKYSVGENPEIIYEPLHKLIFLCKNEIVKKIHFIQNKIWENLQKGSVVIHCKSGVHRAPTMVVCHFLFRYYVIKDFSICNNILLIYELIKSVRPKVRPKNYLPMIEEYERYLQEEYKV